MLGDASFESQLEFQTTLKELPQGRASDLLVCDRFFEELPAFQDFFCSFQAKIFVSSGEALKTLEYLNKFCFQVQQHWPQGSRQSLVFALGGGSVGDFAGFFASTYKRGTGLVHIPSTWLAAIDSSHGGKNGLNVGEIKNLLGTFYPAQRIILNRELLESNPRELEEDAESELFKVALLGGGNLWQKILESKLRPLWLCLPQAIDQKMKILRQDPFETQGHRVQLNLGHTWAHVFELKFGWTHGKSVRYGLWLDLLWSREYFGDSFDSSMLENAFFENGLVENDILKIKALALDELKGSLLQDKKKNHEGFLLNTLVRRPGEIKILKTSWQMFSDFFMDFVGGKYGT